MDGIMSRETVFHQAVQCRAHNGLIVECELIFDNDVGRGMKVPSAFGQADSSISMVLFDVKHSFALIKSKPLLRCRSYFGIVMVHCQWRVCGGQRSR